MSEDSVKILKDISHKLDTLIVLTKLSNQETIQRYKEQLSKDNILSKIMEITVEPITYSELSRKIAQETDVAEITVKRKISELRETGLLATSRKGREVYYENSGLLD